MDVEALKGIIFFLGGGGGRGRKRNSAGVIDS